MERVLAIDPGERVGWCHAEIDYRGKDGIAQPKYKLNVTGHGITELMPFAVKLAEVIGNYDKVIYEVYKISGEKGKLREHIGSEVPTLQFIGMVRILARLSGVPTVRQTLTHRETGFKRAAEWCPQVQEILDRMPKTHDDAHDGDALAHLAYYYTERYL